MKRLLDLPHKQARKHFLRGSSYLNSDLPPYISFEPILKNVKSVLGKGSFLEHKRSHPGELPGVNYNFIANKDGRFAWRPIELMHPAIYVSLVNVICEKENWKHIKKRMKRFEGGAVECCSAPVVSSDKESDKATQVSNWWQRVEQRSLTMSLKYTHTLHTDVTDCYGSLYTHSIAWALHGLKVAKSGKGKKSLLGNKIDTHIQASRHGQTNGISQGSVLMDFIAEIVLGYVDSRISKRLKDEKEFHILRYRDDYRIFTNSDAHAEHILKIISDELRVVGMRLGVAKTFASTNIVEASIKPDKLAGIELQNLGTSNAKTIQKQLLRLHAFGRRFPNSGALKRLVSQLHAKLAKKEKLPDDLEVQAAIATDIAVVSPATFPVVAAILSHLISLAEQDRKTSLWNKVRERMSKVPYNGYLEIWLQRVVNNDEVNIPFESDESICKIVNKEIVPLWENSWISTKKLTAALDVSSIVINEPSETPEKVATEEVELFRQNAWEY